MPRIRLSYTKQQLEIFFPAKPVKFTAVPKGRRFGGTTGGSHACIEWALEGMPILWGDTIYGNIIRYVDRCFKPALKSTEEPVRWEWKDREQVLKIGEMGGYIDFRSEDRPENWEGFGYKRIFLNEAGIILKNKELYVNTVLPMLMDFPDSQLFAVGTPKGKTLRDGSEHPFYTISRKGEEGLENYRTLRYSSYDNPKLTTKDVDELRNEINRMSPGEEQQEIYGMFIDGVSGHEFFHEFRLAEHASTKLSYDPNAAIHVTFDFNSAPYMTALVAQIRKPGIGGKWRVEFLKEYCFEHPMNTTRDVCVAIKTDLSSGEFAGHKAGLFVYGDYSGKASNTMATETERHNYDVIFNHLSRWTSQYNGDKVRPNPAHVRARDFMNDAFAGRLMLEAHVDPGMTNTIRDLSHLKQGPDGDILKEYETDPRTKTRFEKFGHCGQALYYLCCSAFHDTFEEHGRRAA